MINACWTACSRQLRFAFCIEEAPMWTQSWRDSLWSHLSDPWDVLIVGGGITGAGILREATRLGLRALLVEQKDFGWGTSSRSSKLVHGGLRYLQEFRIGLTRASVHERKRLLEEGPGLIDPLGFLLATYKGDRPGRWTYKAGLSVYDLLALQWTHRRFNSADLQMLAPHIAQEGLKGGFRFGDAQTDDARLVLRVIREAVAAGGTALSYVAAEELVRSQGLVASHTSSDGSWPDSLSAAGTRQNSCGGPPVCGARLRDVLSGRVAEVRARVVINATGAWADRLRAQVGAPARIRPLRGSHLLFPCWRLPVAQALSFLHPADRRPVFIFPWEGITLVGTTDLDHDQPLDEEPAISPAEVDYLLAAVHSQYPGLGIGVEDVVSTFSGVRPVIGSGQADPAKESRDHVVWDESGLLTITGGKLTTFRLIALDALRAVRHRLPGLPRLDRRMPVLDTVDEALPGCDHLDEAQRRRLLGRYGTDAGALVAAAGGDELQAIPCSKSLWAELRWAARAEGVVHLDDLLLRRVRLGLLLPEGARELLPRIRAICRPELGWSDRRWQEEEEQYLDLVRRAYGLPRSELVGTRGSS
jgi:glycerol-3-phosphate dehydrogenase